MPHCLRRSVRNTCVANLQYWSVFAWENNYMISQDDCVFIYATKLLQLGICASPTIRWLLKRCKKKSQTCRKRDRSITTCRDRSSRFSTFHTTFYRLKQVLSKIEAMEFRNDQRTFFSRLSTNKKLARSDIINYAFYCDWNSLPRIFFTF